MQKLFVFVTLAAAMLTSFGYTRAQDRASASLAGIVSSDAEGPMEGVLVSAKGLGSTIAVTVVSDGQGRYSFPADRLEPGKHSLSIRAVGYELNDPGLVEVVAKKSVMLDLKLNQTQDLASQLSNTEWLLSVPGSEKEKMQLYTCVSCHSLSTILQSRFDARGFVSILERMRNHTPGSMIVKLGDRLIPYEPVKMADHEPGRAGDAAFAEYLASINLSKDGKRNYEFKTLPRPKGKATKVIITQYDLPSPFNMPHDAAVDREGMVWYTDFARPRMGRLNPRTGGVTEWSLPVVRPGFPEGSVEMDIDSEGNPWIGRLFQGGVAKFDKKTEKVTAWGVPEDLLAGGVNVRTGMVSVSRDGTIWTKSNQNEKLYKLDTETNQWSSSPLPKRMNWYGMAVSSVGNVYVFSIGKGAVGELDVNAGKKEFVVYPTPTPNSGSRRGAVDLQDRVWFAEFYSGKIGMFDPKTKAIREWDASTEPYAGSYDVVPDKNGEAWAGGMHSDRIYRVNSTSDQVTGYLLPSLGTNIRRMDVDNSTTPVAVWIGENHQAKILKLEPLD